MYRNLLKSVKNKWQTIVAIIFLPMAISFSVSAFLPAQYLSEVTILIIQKQTINKVDAFSAAKSAEYLSGILAQVIYSQAFLEDVLVAPFDNKTVFPINSSQRETIWRKMVETKKISDTGLIDIKVYASNKKEAEAMAQSVAWALTVRGHKYHGGGDWVKITKINGPVTSEYPARPNIFLNTFLGFLLGVLAAGATIYFLPDFDLNIFPQKGRDNMIKKKVISVFQDVNEGVFLKQGRLEGSQIKRALNYDLTNEDYTPFIKKANDINVLSAKNDANVSKTEEIKESVKVIEDNNDKNINFVDSKKGEAPKNLPFISSKEEEMFLPDEDERNFLDANEMEKLFNKNKEGQEKEKETKEPTDEEVKRKINDLLKGKEI